MHTRFATQRLRQLARARAYVELNARPITVQRLTGLLSPELHRWFYRNADDAQRGRAPCGPQWYPYANLLQQFDAALFSACFHRLYQRGFTADDALLSAYLGYQALGLAQPRIDFDRAFDLAAHITGRWLSDRAHYAVVPCRTCGNDALTEYGRQVPLGCPFCRVLARYALDPRVQHHLPTPPARLEPAPMLGIVYLSPTLRAHYPRTANAPPPRRTRR